MKNIDLLLSNVNPVQHTSLFGKNRVEVKETILSGNGIYFLLEHIKWMEKRNIRVKTEVLFKCYFFKSSDVVNVIELIMLYTALHFENLFVFSLAHSKLLENNILYINSLLPAFSNKTIGKSFISSFHKNIFTQTHYRRVVNYNETSNYDDTLSIICDEIKYTIKNGCNNVDLAIEASESTIEMIGNVLEHSQSDCIVDVKVALNNEQRIYVSLNVISLSSVYIGNRLMELFDYGNSLDFSGSSIVSKAFQQHKFLFNNLYDYSSFAFVCSFQNTVSTRANITQSGGTGFTTLLKNIHNKSFNEEYASYILSGDNTLYFKNQFLNVDENGIIGFNVENDFYHKKPDDNILKKERIAFPGTIFCVNLVTEKINNEIS